MKSLLRAQDANRGGSMGRVKRVLIVDDESMVLDALRESLHQHVSHWLMTFVERGSRAIVELERQPFDAVITDLRMPGMDGAKLLQIVSERWPHAVRIALCSSSELPNAAALAPVAHQCLAKPCDPLQLENSVDRCLELQELLRRPELRAIVGGIRSLPAIPRTYAMLKSLMANEKTSANDIAKVISADTVLAAKVLQLANSAFFGLARRITNIEQAVTFLGFTAISNVVLSTEVFSEWSSVTGRYGLDLERLQLHARMVAAAGHALTEKTPIADDTMLAGLLHDIGYWVLAQECPLQLQRAVETSAAEGIPLYQAETQVLGASHAEIGAYLLGLWGLPYPVVEAVAHHHEPQRVRQTGFDVLGATAVAHALSGLGDAGSFDIALLPDTKVDAAYLASLNAPFTWEEAERRVQESLKQGASMA